jgi:hypothetical protein
MARHPASITHFSPLVVHILSGRFVFLIIRLAGASPVSQFVRVEGWRKL